MEPIANTVVSLIGTQVNYHLSLDENMNKFKRKCEELNCRKEDVESEIETELKPGKKLKREVELWLATVRRINDEKQSIENQVAEGRYSERRRLGKLVAEKIQEVEDLHQKGSFSGSLVVDAPPRKGAILPTTKLAGETTARRKMEEIWACLLNDDVRKIGLYGMGGSGKTTIMKHINNRIVQETGKFDSVIWVTVSKALNVSKELDVKKLQNDIANALNVNISKCKDETTRVAELFAILREKKRYLLILDDMWKEFRLEVVGIPEPTINNGCKVVLTTRLLDVCRRMDCKDTKMLLLSEEEAWNLFLDNVGQDVLLTPSLKAIAKRVAKECACLPLAILTIAGSMKGIVDECEWRNALEELTKCTKELNEMQMVFGQLKYSYNRLEDEMHQRCLLYCALYPEDHVINRTELIKYLLDEGIIEGMRSRQAEFNKVHSILNKLENACLLESCTDDEGQKSVKMHDLIRDMAFQIMGPRCMVEAGLRLEDIPDEEQWKEDLEKVSLMWNDIVEIRFGASPRCSRLSTLLLLRNPILDTIPGSFFVHMHGLRVLNISNTRIEVLPYSISDLENLTALLLRNCERLKYAPSLAKLQALRKLDLHHTHIEVVPQGMEMLVNLRCLDLNAQYLRTLPVGLLPKLSRLQCLIVYGESQTLEVKGKEVAGLKKLETFSGKFNDIHEFNIYVTSMQGQGPRKYFLQVGLSVTRTYFGAEMTAYLNFDEGGDLKKLVRLIKCSIGRGAQEPLVLPNDIEELVIHGCHDFSSLCDVLSLKIVFLKYCRIGNCDGIECVFSPFSSSCRNPLQSPEVLLLHELRNLCVLFKGEGASPPPPGTFSYLKELQIWECPNIKKLFTPGLLPQLQNLEKIRVSKCKGMEEIIAAKAQGEEEEQGMGENINHSLVNIDDTIHTIPLPKLKILRLEDLPELKSIVCSRAVMVCDSLQELEFLRCPKLKRIPLSLPTLNGQPSPPPSLKCITVNGKWWESLEWDHPYAKNVLQSFINRGRQPIR